MPKNLTKNIYGELVESIGSPARLWRKPCSEFACTEQSRSGGRKFLIIYGKTKGTSKDFAGGLLYRLQKFSDNFYKDFSKRAQEILGPKLNETQLITLRREIYMINMWIISKVLSPDKKVLDELHKLFLLPFTNHFLPGVGHYLLPHVNQKQIDEWIELKENDKLKGVFEKDRNELDERYKKYYENWDDNSSMQNVLAMAMCEYMFNNGQPDRRFVDIRWSFDINAHIVSMMKAILDLHKNTEIID